MTKEDAAENIGKTVSTEGRVHCDMFLGKERFETVTGIVRAAFLAGASFSERQMINSLTASQGREKQLVETVQLWSKGSALNFLAERVHQANTKWWVDLNTGQRIERNVGELLMLTVSELAEAMEGHRKNLQDDKLPQRKMFEVELADAVIRILDICGGLGLDLGGAFEEKMAFNAVREDHTAEARRAENGKKY